MTKSEQHQAYILHRRKYKEQGLWLDIFTKTQGRLQALSTGSTKKQTTTHRYLQPFNLLQLQLTTHPELKFLNQAESITHHTINPKAMINLWYLNELLIRLLPKHQPYPTLFTLYQNTITALNKTAEEYLIRNFELDLLTDLGYGLAFYCATSPNTPLNPNTYYHYYPAQGFTKTSTQTQNTYTGQTLIEINNRHWQNPETLAQAKNLTHQALKPLIGNKPLNTSSLTAPSSTTP